MKRSDVNQIIAEADEFIRRFGFCLPPFAYLSPEQFRERVQSLGSVISSRLGWDITDYGQGDFSKTGLFLFTLRNGSLADLKAGGGMCYAEKIMISRRNQLSPMHRHVLKTEDIINRGGGKLAIQMYESNEHGELDENATVNVERDGISHAFSAGETILLAPGESVTLRPGNWHAFWGEDADVLIGEVSTVNDDLTDNIFRDPVGRFSEIEEDTFPLHLLVSDYERIEFK